MSIYVSRTPAAGEVATGTSRATTGHTTVPSELPSTTTSTGSPTSTGIYSEINTITKVVQDKR